MLFWKRFLLPPRFLVKNAKNIVFEDKWFLSKIFYQIKMQAATGCPIKTITLLINQ